MTSEEVTSETDASTAELKVALAALGKAALDTYAKALKGENIGIAKYRCAADVLRALGVIGDTANAPLEKKQFDIAFVTLTNDSDGNLKVDDSGKSVSESGPAESSDVS